MAKSIKPQQKCAESTKILRCRCVHVFQDSYYGKSMRVHNFAHGAKHSVSPWGCTVCGDYK